ncbi:MAG TPA: hypothetical protein VLA88_06715 [Candidatus Saccharimonadales bacterium]|nr:hypothetical protein [Candidatus Saccharimonadales bacterium]
MNPEHTAFVPFDQLKHKPYFSDDPQRYFDPEKLRGEALNAQVDALIRADHRLNDEQRDRVREYFGILTGAITMNAPMLFLDMGVNPEQEVARAGYCTPAIWMHRRSEGDWLLVLPHYEYDDEGQWHARSLYYSMWTLLDDARKGAERLIIGEDAVRSWLTSRSLATVHMQEPTQFHFERDFTLLRSLGRANMPVDYLGLTDAQRQTMGNYVAAHILDSGDWRTPDLFDVLEYVLGAASEEDRRELYAHMSGLFAERLPVSHHDTLRSELIMVADWLAARMPVIEGAPEGVALRAPTRRLLLLSGAYRHRARTVSTEFSDSLAPLRQVTPDDWPQDHRLYTFTRNNPGLDNIWRDVDYLNYLRRTNVPPANLDINEPRALALSGNFHRLMMEGAHLGDISSILDALEYVADATTNEPNQCRLYNQILYAIANSLPVKESANRNLHRIAGVLEVVLPRLPERLRNYQGESISGPAGVALLMADMYEWRASYFIQADITRTGMDEDMPSGDEQS